MNVTSEYLSELPKWISDILIGDQITEVYDSLYDYKKYSGDYNIRIVRQDKPYIISIDPDTGQMDIIKEIDGKVTIWYNCVFLDYMISGDQDD